MFETRCGERVVTAWPYAIWICCALFAIATGGSLSAREKPAVKPQEDTKRRVAFFNRRILPVLKRHCYRCHSAKSKDVQGGLWVDTRAGLRKGGESGPAVVPGNVEKSLLIDALEHTTLKMPPDRKLPANIIADFRRWVKNGAVDPRDVKPPKKNQRR